MYDHIYNSKLSNLFKAELTPNDPGYFICAKPNYFGEEYEIDSEFSEAESSSDFKDTVSGYSSDYNP